MRTILITLMFATGMSLVSCSKPTPNALCFFVVSQKPAANGHYIDKPSFPKLGYIRSTPDFVLTRLQEVSTNDVTTIHHMVETGETTTNTTPAVSIGMFPDDARRFASFTRQNIGSTVVLFWRGQPLMAPRVVGEIENGRIELAWEMWPFPQEVIQGIQGLLRREQEGEPDSAANRSQSVGPETNRPSAAAGSGR